MGMMTEFARPDGVATKGYLARAGHGRPGHRRDPGMVGTQRPDLRRRRPLRPRRLQRAGTRSVQGPGYDRRPTKRTI